MSGWTSTFDGEACALVARVAGGGTDALPAWRALLIRIAPAIEAWAKQSRVLRRCRLATDDDARAVMVDVLERLAIDNHANLKKFVTRTAIDPDADHELVIELVRLGKLDDEAEPERSASEGTPLRAWLLGLVDFLARDHVRRRLGWSVKEGEPTKRDLHTDAAPLDGLPEPAARPPMTDRIAVGQLVGEIREHMATFPAEISAALQLWLDDVDLPEIASRLQLADAARARALVRAGQARLRERFRGRSPLLFP